MFMWPSFELKRDYFYITSAFASLVCANFRSERTEQGLAPMVPTFSPTEVVAEQPTCAKLRQTETPELREARDLFSLNLRGPP